VARPPLSLGELIEHWSLVGQEIDLVSAKHLDTRLTFALLLKFYGRHGRFPRSRGELHPDAVEFVARALKADPASVAAYEACDEDSCRILSQLIRSGRSPVAGGRLVVR